MTPLLEIQDLHVFYQKKDDYLIEAVKGIQFCLYPGKTLSLVGESGSGKSSTGQALLIRAPKQNNCQVSGKILFEGLNILNAQEEKNIPKIGYVFQDPLQALNPTMKIGKQIAESLLANQKMSKKERISATFSLLESCGLTPAKTRFHQYPHELSGGMRQRVVLAIALAMNPQILIADEPTASLDPATGRQILDLIKSIQQKTNAAILFISHDLAIVSKISQEIAVMYGGKIVESGLTKDILLSPKHPYTKLLIAAHSDYGLGTLRAKEKKVALPSCCCSFVSECPHAMQICLDSSPLFEKEKGCACHLYDKRRFS